MTTKKTYIKGYKYWFSPKSLIRPTAIILENTLPYGNGRLEAMIIRELGTYHVMITDGYKCLKTIHGMKQDLKGVMNITHGWMQNATYETYSRME